MTDSVSGDPFDRLAHSEWFRVLLFHGAQASPGVRYMANGYYAEKRFVGGTPTVVVWGVHNQIGPRAVDAVTAEELSQGPIGSDRGSPGTEPVSGNRADYRILVDEVETS